MNALHPLTAEQTQYLAGLILEAIATAASVERAWAIHGMTSEPYRAAQQRDYAAQLALWGGLYSLQAEDL